MREAELLSQQKERVLFGELSTMEAFLEDLRLLCSCLKKHCQEIKNECEAVAERRDQVKAVAVEAEHIEKLYAAAASGGKRAAGVLRQKRIRCRHLPSLPDKLPAVWTLQRYASAHGGCTDSARRTTKEQHRAAGCASKVSGSRSRLQQGQRSCREKEQLDIWNEKLGQTAAQVEKAQELFDRIAREKQKQGRNQSRCWKKRSKWKKERRIPQLQQEEQTGLWKTQMEALQTSCG